MDFRQLVELYGPWAAMVIMFLYFKLWPLLEQKIIPTVLEKDKTEQEYRRSIESRQAIALEGIQAAIATLSINMAQTNERITNILTNQALIIQGLGTTQLTLSNAISDMKGATGVGRRYDDNKSKEE